jgi:hypothetical protein
VINSVSPFSILLFRPPRPPVLLLVAPTPSHPVPHLSCSPSWPPCFNNLNQPLNNHQSIKLNSIWLLMILMPYFKLRYTIGHHLLREHDHVLIVEVLLHQHPIQHTNYIIFPLKKI